MRRQPPTQEPTEAAARTCPRCGAARMPSALRCTICGQSFASAAEVAELWGPAGDAGAATGEPPLLDLYPSQSDGTVFRAGEDAAAATEPRVDLASDRRPPSGPLSDPWAAAAGTLATQSGKPTSPDLASRVAPTETPRPGGSRLRTVLLAILVILVAGGAAAWYGGRPYLGRQITDNVGGAIDDELDGIAALPVDDAGRIRVVEGDITRAVRANRAAYEPVTAPRVSISSTGLSIAFRLYGAEHTLTGAPAVEEGRVVLGEPVLAGPARRVVDVEALVASSEASIAELFARADLRPVSLRTSDDTLVITTEPVSD